MKILCRLFDCKFELIKKEEGCNLELKIDRVIFNCIRCGKIKKEFRKSKEGLRNLNFISKVFRKEMEKVCMEESFLFNFFEMSSKTILLDWARENGLIASSKNKMVKGKVENIMNIKYRCGI